ncbi:hypothetical protein TCAL_15248 [Tigriopus californicus]|uniref:HEAT repeat-containing protein 5B n=1 Tax=Tigriopus californicus TaxID=6832 RepID=A0A553NBY3_TIGCA|nr:hypothetical protein TCAL_15248 [Tigriopus californicus]
MESLSRQSLTLDEVALARMVEAKRAVFVYEWLRYLDQVLPTVARPEIKTKQKVLVGQLLDLIRQGVLGPPSRVLAAQCLTTLFRVGDTFLLFDTINKCNDWLKNKDDSPSFLPTRLGAICVLGHMYETLGRMTGRSYEETVQVLNKGLKNAESQIRMETMVTFGKVCEGLGTAASNIHRDIFKSVRSTLADRAHIVRAASAQCLLVMSPYATFVTTTELENVATMCFRAFEGASYETRKAVAKCLGTILANTQQEDPFSKGRNSGMMIQRAKKGPTAGNTNKRLPLGDVLAIIMQGFLKGGSSGSGLIKGGSTPVSQDVRVGVTHCYVIMVQTLGPQWLEKNLSQLLNHVLELASHPKAATSHVDAVYSRRCVGHIIQVLLGKMLSEQAQMAACKEMIAIVEKLMSSLDVHSENTKDSSNQETLFSQHLIVVALQELGTLFQRLGTVSRTLIVDHHLHLTNVLCSLLVHPSQAPRLAASWCLRCLCVASPSHLTPILDRCLEGLEKLKASADAVSGYSSAIAALLGAVRLTPLGIPHTRGKIAFNVGEDLLRSASQNSRLSKERTQAGWLLIGSVMTLGPAVVKGERKYN